MLAAQTEPVCSNNHRNKRFSSRCNKLHINLFKDEKYAIRSSLLCFMEVYEVGSQHLQQEYIITACQESNPIS